MEVFWFEIPAELFVGDVNDHVWLAGPHQYVMIANDLEHAKSVARSYLGPWISLKQSFDANSKSVEDFFAYEHEKSRLELDSAAIVKRFITRLVDDLGSIDLVSAIFRISVADGSIVTEFRLEASEGERRRVIYDLPMKPMAELEYLDLLELIQDYF